MDNIPPPVPPHQFEAPPELPKKSKMPVWAWVLIAVCGCGCVIIPVLAAILFPVFSQAKLAAKSTVTISNMKRASLGFLMYANDSDDVLPSTAGWNQKILPYAKNDEAILVDASIDSSADQRGIGMNPSVANRNLASFENPANVVLLGLGDPGQDATVTLQSVRMEHSKKTPLAFTDGHVSRITLEQVQAAEWDPVIAK